MNILGIIPARYASTRFPGKPLTTIEGKPMIQHVYEKAINSGLFKKVVVATDDTRIQKAVLDFGGEVCITSSEHNTGTDRCGETWNTLKQTNNDFQVIVNIQGDEPYLNTEQLSNLIAVFSSSKVEIATLKKKITQKEELFSANVVKVISGKNEAALYFSRQAIPFCRDIQQDEWLKSASFFKHIGVYAFRTEILEQLILLSQSQLEKAESLEQLRWLENGFSITLVETFSETVAIDTPEDLEKLKKLSL